MPSRGQVDDRQTPVPQSNGPVDPVTFAIRSAMCDDVGHPLDNVQQDRRPVKIDYTSNATHD